MCVYFEELHLLYIRIFCIFGMNIFLQYIHLMNFLHEYKKHYPP